MSVLDRALSLHSALFVPLHLVAGGGVCFDTRAGCALVRDSDVTCKALQVLAGDSRA